MSLLDGYSGYNQILVHEDDQDKTTFTTPWRTFHYAKMSFGLKNVGATVQWVMDITFSNEKDVFLVVYLDDLTVFSNSDEDHLYHLKIVFLRCRKYGISLNPKKSLFAMDEGKLLGHIISKEGICIDPARVETIQKIDFPRNPEGRRGKWIAALLEYDLEIKLTKLIKGQGLAKLMAESNLHVLDINLIAAMSEENEENLPIQVSDMFLLSSWYSNIIYVLKNLSSPPGMAKNKIRALKLKAAKFCIMNGALYWKDPSGVLLNCLVEEEEKQVMKEFHKGDYGGHLFWKTTANKLLRARYDWPTLFANVYKTVASYHECRIFQGKRKLQPLPLKPIEVSAPFQQWGLDFIGCHKKLVNALWASRVSQKKSIGVSPFELVYGVDTFFPTSSVVLVVKLLQEVNNKDDGLQRRINQKIHLQQTREDVFQNTFKLQERIKRIYDQKAKADKFEIGDIVLKWDARNEEKGKHGKFENLWKGPYKIVAYRGQNAFLLQELNGEDCLGGAVNGRFLKQYYL
eukprot:PITA_12050